jgi:glycosyltransferase involved in cell wall biosynthesis
VATASDSTDAARPGPPRALLVVTLVTRGSPAQLTGGHLYHRRMAEAAPARDAVVEFVSLSRWQNPMGRARGVVVVDSITAWSVAPWMVFRPTRPVAAILHQPPGGIGQPAVRAALQRPLDRAFYRRCDLLIAASRALGSDLVDAHGLPASRVCVVEPGCDLPLHTAAPADLRRGRRIALLCVANWSANKGLLELFAALAGLPDDHATLHLAGRDDVDAVYAAKARARLARPDLRGRVVTHGPLGRDEIAILFANADGFVLPSYVETYGTVYGEALAAGLPTVGWRAGNLPNLVTDGREGCLVAPGDVDGLRAVLERLATDEPWREGLADAARRRGASLPTWDAAADAFFGALRRLAADRG